MNIEIILVQSDAQIASLAKIADIVWHETYDPLIETAQVDYMVEQFQSEQAVKKQMETAGYRYFMVRRGGKDIGFTGVVPYYAKPDELFLSKAYVLNEARGCGAFGRIMEQVTGLARELGLTGIWLTVNKQNRHAQAVYRHYGFEIAEEKCTDIGKGYVMDDYVMRLALSRG